MTQTLKTFLICGSGGVGKTTVSAALGLKYALAGKKAIVLTIDPAKRLATALGISELNNIPKKIETNGKGEMWAMMLDTKKTFDSIVEKYAPSKEAMNAILENRVYRHMSQMLAGTQEYMAMEKLYEIHQLHDYEIIVLDTPPMQNAKEFLAAPQKMVNMISNSMLQLLLKPAIFFGKPGFKIIEKGTKQIFKVLDRIAGLTFLQELSEMFILLKDLLAGFSTRAAKVRSLLANPDCHFVSVCTTSENSILEAYEFQQQLEVFKNRLSKIIANRVYTGKLLPSKKLKELKTKLKSYYSNEHAELLIKNYNKFIPLVQRDQEKIEQLQALVGENKVITIPLFLSDVHDLDSLQEVATELADNI